MGERRDPNPEGAESAGWKPGPQGQEQEEEGHGELGTGRHSHQGQEVGGEAAGSCSRGGPVLEDKPEWASTNATERSGWKEAAGPNQSCLPRGPGLPRAKKQGATDEGEAARPLAPLGEPGGGGREPEAQGGRRDRILFTAVGWETRACSQGKPPGDPNGTRVGDGGGRGGGPTGGPERGGHSPPHQPGQRVLKEGGTRH